MSSEPTKSQHQGVISTSVGTLRASTARYMALDGSCIGRPMVIGPAYPGFWFLLLMHELPLRRPGAEGYGTPGPDVDAPFNPMRIMNMQACDLQDVGRALRPSVFRVRFSYLRRCVGLVATSDGADDTPALMAAVSTYASDASIVFQANTTHNIWSSVTFPELTNVEVVIEGDLSYPTSIQMVQNYVAASGWVDGHGQQWWDIVQQVNRPYGWLFGNIDTGVTRNMKIYKVGLLRVCLHTNASLNARHWQPIAWNFLTTGSNNFHNNTILAGSDDGVSTWTHRRGLMSDASTDWVHTSTEMDSRLVGPICHSNHVVNGDDCLTAINGAKNITWRSVPRSSFSPLMSAPMNRNSYCEGSRWLSVGSLGKDGQDSLVENVFWIGGNGAVINATWRNIMFIDVMFPIYVTQHYWDQVVRDASLRVTSKARASAIRVGTTSQALLAKKWSFTECVCADIDKRPGRCHVQRLDDKGFQLVPTVITTDVGFIQYIHACKLKYDSVRRSPRMTVLDQGLFSPSPKTMSMPSPGPTHEVSSVVRVRVPGQRVW
ncbi:Pectin lyase fold/virulence factor [Tylopilus felleus]